MTEEHTAILLEVKSWNDATPWQRGAFSKEMEGRRYGRDALTQAWAWFLTGWRSCQD